MFRRALDMFRHAHTFARQFSLCPVCGIPFPTATMVSMNSRMHACIRMDHHAYCVKPENENGQTETASKDTSRPVQEHQSLKIYWSTNGAIAISSYLTQGV